MSVLLDAATSYLAACEAMDLAKEREEAAAEVFETAIEGCGHDSIKERYKSAPLDLDKLARLMVDILNNEGVPT